MSTNNTQVQDNSVDFVAEIERLKAENAALKARQATGKGMIKIGDKGGVVVSGVTGSFPVTLYKEQWITLLGMANDILSFIKTNEALLKSRDPNHVSLRQQAKAAGVGLKEFIVRKQA